MYSPDRLAAAFIYGLGLAVCIAWVASVGADIAIASYSTPAAVHGLMGIVVGAIFGVTGRAKSRVTYGRRETDRRDPNRATDRSEQTQAEEEV